MGVVSTSPATMHTTYCSDVMGTPELVRPQLCPLRESPKPVRKRKRHDDWLLTPIPKKPDPRQFSALYLPATLQEDPRIVLFTKEGDSLRDIGRSLGCESAACWGATPYTQVWHLDNTGLSAATSNAYLEKLNVKFSVSGPVIIIALSERTMRTINIRSAWVTPARLAKLLGSGVEES